VSNDAKLSAAVREKLGSRSARKLRREGRIPCSLQPGDDEQSRTKPHVDLHIDEDAFLAARRHHVHLFDLDFEGKDLESAVIREIQYDQLGDNILHVEFRSVTRGIKTEAEVPLTFTGHLAEGDFVQLVDHITVLTLPSQIPDEIEISMEGLQVGDHIKAGSITLPEGASLAIDPDTDLATCSAHKEVAPASEEDMTVEPEPEAEEGSEG